MLFIVDVVVECNLVVLSSPFYEKNQNSNMLLLTIELSKQIFHILFLDSLL